MNIFISYILPIYLFLGIGFSVIDYSWRSGVDFKEDYYIRSIRSLYEQTSMNYISCVVVWFVWLLMTPFSSIGYIIFWLTHVGRKRR